MSKIAAGVFPTFHQLYSQRKIRRRVGMKATVELLLALIISRLDCRNSLLAGVPQSTLNPL